MSLPLVSNVLCSKWTRDPNITFLHHAWGPIPRIQCPPEIFQHDLVTVQSNLTAGATISTPVRLHPWPPLPASMHALASYSRGNHHLFCFLFFVFPLLLLPRAIDHDLKAYMIASILHTRTSFEHHQLWCHFLGISHWRSQHSMRSITLSTQDRKLQIQEEEHKIYVVRSSNLGLLNTAKIWSLL